jgi:uncharacterized protein
MQIKTYEIPETGMTLDEQLNPDGLELQTEDLKFTQPVSVKADLIRERDAIVVHVTAQGPMELVCRRCLKRYKQDFSNSFDLGYSAASTKVLELTPDIRQEIMLHYPAQFLCQENCKGLCAGCGVNLNQEDCRCD